MITVNGADVTIGTARLVTEASTIGLPPGRWPTMIKVEGITDVFVIKNDIPDGGRIYRNASGAELAVLND